MKRRVILKGGAVTALTMSINIVHAKDDNMLGKMSGDEFKKINADAAAGVKALKPTSAPLEDNDKDLLNEIALGGMMQLRASELALEKCEAKDVRVIAQAEVDEQKGLSAKLEEIAAAKGAALPKELDKRGQKVLADLKEDKGEFDKKYLEESGVKGHQILQKTMKKVRDKAKDQVLKELAGLALPLIQTHLEVSREEAQTLS